MDSYSIRGFCRPEFVWGFNYKNKVTHVGTSGVASENLDYRDLVHPEDLSQLQSLIRLNVKMQRRQFQRSRQVVSIHRVRDDGGSFAPHLCLINLARDKFNRLAFLYGINYRMPADAPLNTAEQQYLALLIRNATDRLSPFVTWLTNRFRRARVANENSDPFYETWSCGHHVISPSLFQMGTLDGRVRVELSEKQARFIALLLGARDLGGTPVFVERAFTRSAIFGTDPHSRLCDNDIDQLVKFFRQHLGRRSIKTKRGFGHLLKAKRHICTGSELEGALALLWGSRVTA